MKKTYYGDLLDLMTTSSLPEIRSEQTSEGYELDVFELPEVLVERYRAACAEFMSTRAELIRRMRPQADKQTAQKKWREPKRKPRAIMTPNGMII